jgi:AraC-like DNA-binding protein
MRVSAIHIRALLEGVETAGMAAADFMRMAGLADGALADPYGEFSLTELDRLTCLAPEATGDPAFGLHWGERAAMQRFDIVGMLFTQATSLRAGLQAVLRSQTILSDQHELLFEERASHVTLRLQPLALTATAARIRAELGMNGIVRLLGHVGLVFSRDTRHVGFAHDRPAYGDEYMRIFGSQCRFRQAYTGVEFDRAWLDRPLPTANPELHQVIVAQAERVRQRVHSSGTFARQLRANVHATFPNLPSMRVVARSMGLSERSLRRRLEEEGVSFTEIVQAAQRELAERLLRDRARSIQQVAAEAGFASVTAFHRAFKRWTGQSPASYRVDGSDNDPTT